MKKKLNLFSLPYERDLGDYGLRTEFDESLADRRYFTPTREAVKNVPAGSPNDARYYDFPDGKDDGREMPIARKKGVDIAEVDSALRVQKTKVSDAVKKQKELDAIHKRVEGSDSVTVGSAVSEKSEK